MKAVVLGAGGFIGSNLVDNLKKENYIVRGVDLKYPEFSTSSADEFLIGDLRDPYVCKIVIPPDVDEVYQLAADMGGAGHVFTGEHDAEILWNNTSINLNIIKECTDKNILKVFFSSSACVYPKYNQLDPSNPKCEESSVYPAAPDSEYGWEKLFSEHLYLSFKKQYGLDIRIGRYHNIFGSNGTYTGGKEKAPAALCRKVIEAKDGTNIEIWGDGTQTRSFLYIDTAIEATKKLMQSNYFEPINIGSTEMVSITNLAQMIIDISGKKLDIKYIKGPIGVAGRNSDNKLIKNILDWEPEYKLETGIKILYNWIEEQINTNTWISEQNNK